MKRFLVTLLIMWLLSIHVYAVSDKTKILVQFVNANNPNLAVPVVYNETAIESVNIMCNGYKTDEYPNGYQIESSFAQNDFYKTFFINVSGPFDGDHRTVCKIRSSETQVDSVYFSLENLVLTYSKGGDRYYKCYIHGLIGTSYDHYHFANDELHAEYPNIETSCVAYAASEEKDTNPDSYIIYPGHMVLGMQKTGKILIKIK